MNPVCSFIEFIKDLTNDEYCHNISYLPSEIYYQNGGCYELVKTLKFFLEDSQIYVKNDFGHCVLFYKGLLYDINGIVEDNQLYHLADSKDMMYLEDPLLFGRSEIKFDNLSPSEALIKNILNCRIESLITECQKMDDNSDYYNKKQKIKTSL